MKVQALIRRFQDGSLHVLIDTLSPLHVIDVFKTESRAFPENTPVLVEFELPVEEAIRNGVTQPAPMAMTFQEVLDAEA